MKRNFLNILVCPKCQGELNVETFEEQSENIEEGALICKSCNVFYPVIDSIPRMLDAANLSMLVTGYHDFVKRYHDRLEGFELPDLAAFDTDKRIATGFEFEWSHHDSILPEHELELNDVFGDVLDKESFRGKTVLDAGCGQGRFSFFVSSYGAKNVVSMDMGEQVLIAKRNVASRENVYLVQASIFAPPFRQSFDRIVSIGVIHHLPEPEAGFRKLYEYLKPDGDIFIWVYGYSSIIPIIRFLRLFTKGLSDRVNRFLAIPFALLLFGMMKVYNLLGFIGLKDLAKLIPWNMYHDRGFSNIWTITFDKLNSVIAVYYKREDLEGWIDRVPNCARAVLSERYPGKSGSSWRLLVKKQN